MCSFGITAGIEGGISMEVQTAAQFVLAALAFGTMYVLFVKDTL